MRKSVLAAAALAVATIGLAGCGSEPAPTETAPEAPEAPEGVAVTNARLILPAVKGNPGALYFAIANTGSSNLVVRAASIDGAGSAVFHKMGTWNKQVSMDEVGQIPVPPGSTVTLEPGGMHVMAIDLADTVVAGGKTEVTLTFVGGDKISFPADVHAAGDER
jgi:copper(I)-binding protein